MNRTVACVVSTLDRVGPVNVLGEILAHLDREKYHAIVITLSPEPHNSRIDEFRASGICVQQLKMSRTASLLAGRRRLKRFVEFCGADFVHCHGFRADVLAASAGLARPMVSTIHADLAQDYRLAYGPLVGSFMTHREYAALRRFRAVVAVSDSAAERAAQFGVKAEVIPNGIDLAAYAPPCNRAEISKVRDVLGWPKDRLVVLHTGALISRKRPLEVIAAFLDSSLSRKGLLVFAGEGALLEECKRAASGHPGIEFLGHRSDLPLLLRAADAVVSNSTSEGLPMALLEACASGLRVLASDIRPHLYIAELFPAQVTLLPITGPGPLVEALNAVARRGSVGPIQPPSAALEKISGERMSQLYQDLYDGLWPLPSDFQNATL